MGDINFNIQKNVDLNKQVNLEINKNVNANVENEDLLATSETDAEAFGEDALAETDAFTYVNGEPGDGEQGPERPGLVDVLGNTTNINVESGDTNGDGAAENIIVDFASAGSIVDGLPDVDDVNGFGVFTGVDAPPPGQDNTLPVNADGELILSITDLNLAQTGATFPTPGEDLEAEYENTTDWVVNFGPTELDLDGDGTPTTSDLLLTVPAGNNFLALYAGPGEIPPEIPPEGPIEIAFEAFVVADAFFTHDGVNYDATGFVFEAESLQNPDLANIGDYAFEAEGIFPGIIVPGMPGNGEAFSYGESTAALDLNGDGDMV